MLEMTRIAASMIEAALRRHPRLVIALARLTRRLEGSFEQVKADVYLVDGSRLHINYQKWVNEGQESKK